MRAAQINHPRTGPGGKNETLPLGATGLAVRSAFLGGRWTTERETTRGPLSPEPTRGKTKKKE